MTQLELPFSGADTHVMLDLETLALGVDAAIIQIAAQVFSLEAGPKYSIAPFEAFVADTRGRAVDARTVAWWLQQTAAPAVGRKLAAGGPLPDALQALSDWFTGVGPVAGVWSHGLGFDMPILEHAYAQCGIAVPWGYKLLRDTRTLYMCAPGGMPDVGRDPARAHDATYDCALQIAQVCTAFAALEGR